MRENPIRAGLDEVGWGALAGPVISVVAAFQPEHLHRLPPGVRDSKKTTELQRRDFYPRICHAVLDLGVGHAWPWEIDELGPDVALQLSYRRALEDMKVRPDLLIVDGSNPVSWWKGKQSVVPKADVTFKEVGAASMVAKHFRDTIMKDYAKLLRKEGFDYGWDRNMGYGTPEHERAILKQGLFVNRSDKTRYLHRLRFCRKFMYEGRVNGA